MTTGLYFGGVKNDEDSSRGTPTWNGSGLLYPSLAALKGDLNRTAGPRDALTISPLWQVQRVDLAVLENMPSAVLKGLEVAEEDR